jgi:cytochrome c peroxidase
MGRFRAPSLRNVAVTAPYMHDGSVATLSDVLDNYANGGRFPDAPGKDPLVLGFTLTPAEKADVITFLHSLTDEGFLSDPRFADPWPDGHPARATRTMPLPKPRMTP